MNVKEKIVGWKEAHAQPSRYFLMISICILLISIGNDYNQHIIKQKTIPRNPKKWKNEYIQPWTRNFLEKLRISG